MREEEEGWWYSRWLFPLFIGAVITLALVAMVPNLPWVKSVVDESGRVVSVNGNSCVVETYSHRLINVNECMNHEIGDSVTVTYRETTSLGELSSASLMP